MSEQVPICPWRAEEIGFCFAVDLSLIRDARMHGVAPSGLLEQLLRPLNGQLKLHLDRHPRFCAGLMVDQLAKRMGGLDLARKACFTWEELLQVAASAKQDTGHFADRHVQWCPFCQRDVRQLRAKLPYYSEFTFETSRFGG